MHHENGAALNVGGKGIFMSPHIFHCVANLQTSSSLEREANIRILVVKGEGHARAMACARARVVRGSTVATIYFGVRRY
jgi:hypothetical protein